MDARQNANISVLKQLLIQGWYFIEIYILPWNEMDTIELLGDIISDGNLVEDRIAPQKTIKEWNVKLYLLSTSSFKQGREQEDKC